MAPNDNPQAAEPMSPERLAEIRARVDAATPGPWHLDDDGAEIKTPDHGTIADIWEPTQESRNGEFIAGARTDVPDLLAENDRLTTELAKYVGHEPTIAEEMQYLSAENDRLTARVAELERPEIERKRNEIRASYSELAASAEEQGDHEGAAITCQRLADREAEWAAEDKQAGWTR